VSLKLPLAPGAYDKGDQAQMRGAVERADLQNRKRQEDLVLGPGQRLVFYDEHGAEQRFTGAILGGLVRSDMAAQGLSPAEQANARANIATGSGAGLPGGSSGQVQFNSGGAFGGFTVGGDASLNVLTGALSLAAVNADTGVFGDAAHVGQFSVNAKGLVTAVSSVPIAFPVTAFNARTGAITLASADVITALGFTPLAAASPAYVRNLGNAPSVQEGTHAVRPAAGNSGALYVETDTKTLWRDSGGGWDNIVGGAETSIPLVTGAEPPALVSDGAGHLITVAYAP
jgi:hypothetical protein